MTKKRLFSLWAKELFAQIFVQAFNAMMLACFMMMLTGSSAQGLMKLIVVYSFRPINKWFINNVAGVNSGLFQTASEASRGLRQDVDNRLRRDKSAAISGVTVGAAAHAARKNDEYADIRSGEAERKKATQDNILGDRIAAQNNEKVSGEKENSAVKGPSNKTKKAQSGNTKVAETKEKIEGDNTRLTDEERNARKWVGLKNGWGKTRGALAEAGAIGVAMLGEEMGLETHAILDRGFGNSLGHWQHDIGRGRNEYGEKTSAVEREKNGNRVEKLTTAT